MQKMYLLLRKNKQSGPFPLRELIKLDLKPMDLLWEEGKSKSWSYPTEIPELKDYVKGDNKVEDVNAVYPHDKPELVLPKINPKQATIKNKENIHVEVYVKLPERYKAGSVNDGQTKPEEKQIVSEKDREVDAMNAPGYEVLNKKYVRDLDDIKEEYSRWLGKQKNNPLEPVKKKFMLRWAILLVLIVVAFIAERWNGSDASGNIDLKADSVKVESRQVKPVIEKTQKNKKSSSSSTQETVKNKKTVTGSLLNLPEKQKQIKEEKQETPPATPVSNDVEKKIDAETVFQKLDVKYSYDTTSHEGMPGLHFTMHNHNQHTLNTVALHVFYKNHEGVLLQKETIYFNHLLPGKSSTTVASPHSKTTAVTFKPGLASMDGKMYYSKDD